jgi:2-polyprenyl-3-methyl-5-hydroxy-6-metoxy-1,4-benzoquinol methylase
MDTPTTGLGLGLGVSSCPVCRQNDALRPLCEVGGFEILSCAHCDTDFVAHPPSREALRQMYDQAAYFEGGDEAAPGTYREYDGQTAGTLHGIDDLLESLGDANGRSVLDVGCAYGTHLELARRRGWACFGVEPSQHARQVATERLGSGVRIVSEIDDLVPHEFDLILMLDVIEHLPDPYRLFYELYSKGAIQPRTRIVITTPNAGSRQARSDPSQWAYRHPPAHLVFYSARSFERLLQTLHFSQVQVRGLYPDAHGASDDLGGSAALLVEAQGSDFAAFMQERYVPGTWSRIAAFEHLPRYRLAAGLAGGKKVLDFGCGTGYGSALLAQSGAQVTALDIDARAIAWARATHARHAIDFLRSDDFGESLPEATFDLITCFEMIEHVTESDQHRTLASLARLLKPGGLLLMSTPNPEVTRRYGENPFHLREMTREEFLSFLKTRFEQVRLVGQSIRVDIAFEEISDPVQRPSFDPVRLERRSLEPEVEPAWRDEAVAWVAMCSAQPIAHPTVMTQYSSPMDYVTEFISFQNALNRERMLVQQGLDRSSGLALQISDYQRAVCRLEGEISSLGGELSHARQTISQLSIKPESLAEPETRAERLNRWSRRQLSRWLAR